MKTALLVIDYIKEIANEKPCSVYLSKHPEVIRNTNIMIGVARAINMLIIHLRLAFESDYKGLPKNAPVASYFEQNHLFLLGTPNTEFIDEIDVQATDMILNKKYGDPFCNSGLSDVLKANGIQNLIFTGLATDNAILFGTNSAMINNYYVIVVEDACGATSDEANIQAIKMMKNRSVDEFVDTHTLCNKLKQEFEETSNNEEEEDCSRCTIS